MGFNSVFKELRPLTTQDNTNTENTCTYIYNTLVIFKPTIPVSGRSHKTACLTTRNKSDQSVDRANNSTE